MSTYKGLNPATNNWNVVAIDDYREEISYDPNGNIQTYKRNGTTANGKQLLMDKMTYQYPKDAGGNGLNNRLRYVHDEVSAANYTEDIDSQTPLTLAQVQAEKLPEQQTDNYVYDAIGNLIQDKKEGINKISWNVYGKIESIIKTGSSINYTYDASGNRISKTISTNQPINQSTFYVRDAGGNVMGIYGIDPQVNQGKLTQNEVHLYGSSRLGIANTLSVSVKEKNMAADFGTAKLSTFTRGEKIFELSNHLGNVLATVSDKKIFIPTHKISCGPACTKMVPQHYEPDVVSATDYAPFGMGLVGRKFGAAGRYGFNGKENDKEVSEGAQDYGMRINEVRLGRFLSVDPISSTYPMLTPYQFASNRPIDGIDLDGLEWAKKVIMKNGKTSEILYTVKLKVINSTQTMTQENVNKAIGDAKDLVPKIYDGFNKSKIKTTYKVEWVMTTDDKIDINKDFYLEFIDDPFPDIFAGKTEKIGNTSINHLKVLSPFGIMKLYKASKFTREQADKDIPNTIAHEIGHTGGLRHDDDPSSPKDIPEKIWNDGNNIMDRNNNSEKQSTAIPEQRTIIGKNIPKSQTTIEKSNKVEKK
jgi:RHS repeat-associated protein